MPIFCNVIRVTRASENSLRSVVATWLTEKTGGNHKFTASNLFNPLEMRADRTDVAVISAEERDPKTISISLRHPDDRVPGRRWETQIGIVLEDEAITFTLDLEHSDVNAKVTADNPPITSVPGVISKVAARCELTPDMIGRDVKDLTEDDDTINAVQFILGERDRHYPVIIVSANADGQFLVNPNTLQNQLAGIAMVIRIPNNVDTRMLADKIGRRYIPYGGAINVIRPPTRSRFGEELSYIFTADRLNDLKDTTANRVNPINSAIVERVVFISNGLKLRDHLTPAAVRIKQQRDARISLRERTDRDLEKLLTNLQTSADKAKDHVPQTALDEIKSKYEQERQLYEDEIADLTGRIETLKQDLVDANQLVMDADEDAADAKRAAIAADGIADGLKAALADARRAGAGLDDEARYALQDLIASQSSKRQLTPAKCLKLIEAAYPERITILPEALESAMESETYSKPHVLLDLLTRLATKYIDAMIAGGDTKAKTVFTPEEYSARESDTVKNMDNLRRKREISFRGKTVMMERHLRNSTENQVALSIRVYFIWDPEEGRVYVGYCGPHMPTSTRHK